MSEPFIEMDEARFNPIPSLITLGNAFCGFASIVYAIVSYARGEPLPPVCIWLLLGAMVFDTLDGLAARMLNATSLHGAQLDSLADVVSFGLAPAVTIFVFISRNCPGASPPAVVLIWSVSLFYLACTMWRLARYNVMDIRGEKTEGCFMGLPSPAAASMIYSAGLFLPKVDMGAHLFFSFLLGYAFLTGLLMISSVPYPHVRRCVSGEPRILSFVFICVVFGSIAIFRLKALVIWAYIYFLIAPLAELLVRKRAGRPVREFLFSAWGKNPFSRA
ncbi:MAG: phosphatidylcholine/phosphatidylserine synthase [Pontiellaceae bacterium]|jgi:CDP-diacylglycerol--serine O-phosphatidyltransferase|nr:phosphatidylcholine/phosphatidylserine synthase [Pontiellaceae bacterium]